MAKVLKKRRSRYFFQNDQRKSLVAPLPKRQKRHLRLAHHEAGQNGGLSNQWPHEQPTFGPQRYPKSAAWQVNLSGLVGADFHKVSEIGSSCYAPKRRVKFRRKLLRIGFRG